MHAAGTAGLPPASGRDVARASGLGPGLQAGLALLIVVGCLVPAAINGLPLVFPDTEGYLASAQSFRPQHVRAFGYGAWLRVTGALWSLWLPVLAQAVLAAWLTVRAIALEAPRWPAVWRPAAALALVVALLLGHLPWLAAWIQPDLFTGLLVLAVWLLAEHWERLARPERWLMLATALGAATTHLTHPPLLAGIGLFALAVAALRRWRPARPWRDNAPPGPPSVGRTALPALAGAALAWGLLAGANWITYRVPASSVGGSVFLFARLAADGDPAAALRPGCEAGAPWAVCRHLDSLGMPADEFLWRAWSPLPELGYTSGFMAEAAVLNPILLRHDWPSWLAKSAARVVAQLGTAELGDGMDSEGPWMVAAKLDEHGLDRMVDEVIATRQAVDGMRPLMPRLPAEALAAGGVLALVGVTAGGLLRRRPSLWWPALLFLACWVGNAALIALGGEVHGRYGARLAWLAPLLAGLLVLRAVAPRQTG